MTDFFALLPQMPSLEEIVRWGGYLGLFAIIFSETGLLVGFFLPGDSLLFTAGLLAANPDVGLNIILLNAVLMVAAVSGDATGYAIGRKAGHTLYNRPQSRFFRRDHLLKTRAFYEKYGGITIFLARFMPFARTFAPVVAGVADMTYARFAVWNISGGVSWILSMTLLGYFLGSTVPGVREHIEFAVIGIVFLSILPMLIKYLQHRLKARAASDPS